MIDYVLGKTVGKERVERLMVGDNIESDHHSLEIWFMIERSKGRKKERKKKNIEKRIM